MKTRFTGRAAVRLLAVIALFLAAAPFRAVGAGDTKEVKPFRFVVYGDTRDGHEVHRKLVALIMKENPSLVFQTGDLVHTGTDAKLWKIYDDITGEMRKKIDVYPVRGNHDFGGSYYDERMTAPIASGNKEYYTVDKENCHFIVLDIDEHAAFGPTSAQYQWLIKDLDAAKAKAKHIFAFFHVPPYSIGSHGPNRGVQLILCPVFDKYGVRVVFCGHDHIYYHTVRKGIHYVVTGGGGAPLYDIDPGLGAIEGDRYEKVNHIMVCDVKGDDVTIEALRPDATSIERFTVSAPSSH